MTDRLPCPHCGERFQFDVHDYFDDSDWSGSVATRCGACDGIVRIIRRVTAEYEIRKGDEVKP